MVIATVTLTTTALEGASSAAAASAFGISMTFTPPPACSQSAAGLTMLKNRQYQIWLNEPLPVPGTTFTSCYPSQFISSFLLERGGVTQAPFSPLVCPQGYTTQGPYTSNYIACCPSGWDGLAPAATAPSSRPAYSGTCYLNLYNNPIKVTLYDDASVQASSIYTATDSLAQAYAYPYEGYAFGVAQLASTTPTTTGAGASTPPSTTPSASTSPTAPAAATTPFSTNTSSTTLSSGAIAGIVIGSLAGAVLLLSLLLLLLLRHRRTASDVPQYEPQDPYPPNHNYGRDGQGGGIAEAKPTGASMLPFLAISEMEAKRDVPPQEMPSAPPRRRHELEGRETGAAGAELGSPQTGFSYRREEGGVSSP